MLHEQVRGFPRSLNLTWDGLEFLGAISLGFPVPFPTGDAVATKSRPYGVDDTETLIAIIRAHLHDDVVVHIGPWSRSEAMLLKTIPQRADDILVVEVDGQIIAFLWTEMNEDHLSIEEIHVIASARGRGVGRRLLEESERQARDRGVAELQLTVFKESPAVTFYQRAGYTIAGETKRHQYRLRKSLPTPR